MKKEWKDKIYYSQCWEDPYVLLDGLEIDSSDRILSITSGGCNSLALLLRDPMEVVALDMNPAQNNFFELKVAAIKHLPYEKMLAFMGVNPSRNRRRMFEVLETHLSGGAKAWWRSNVRLLDDGLIHVGQLERYFRFFSAFVLPFIHSKKMVLFLFKEKTQKQQRDFYAKSWNTWRWRFFVKIFFSRALASRAGRNKNLFRFVDDSNITDLYLNKVENAICNEPWNNYFLRYIFTGGYDERYLPPYLVEKNVEIIKNRLDRLKIASADIFSYAEPHYREIYKVQSFKRV